MLKHLPLDQLIGPRTLLRPVLKDSVQYRELVDSIRKEGILQSILVRPYKGKYEVVEGNHRYTAARELNLAAVPCIIKEMTDKQARILQVALQAIRLDAKPMEYCVRVQELIDSGTTLKELSVLLGKRVEWLRDILKLRRVTKAARKYIDDGDISLRAAVALSRLPIHLQKEYLDEAVVLPSAEFIERARQVLKHYREGVRKDKIDAKYVHMEAKPYLRTMREIREEVTTFGAAGVHLKLDGATTALEGWKSCIKWLLHLDPISLEENKEKSRRAVIENINYYERRKRDRQLRNQLLGESHDECTRDPES